jgi:hypothetical protein
VIFDWLSQLSAFYLSGEKENMLGSWFYFFCFAADGLAQFFVGADSDDRDKFC